MKRLTILAIAMLVAFAGCSTQKTVTKEKEPMSTEEWVKLRMETLESEGWTLLETTEPPQEILAQHYGRILEKVIPSC